MICYVGNSYGYSKEAVTGIKKIFKKLSLEIWTTFFSRENFLEEKVVESLSNAESWQRWDAFKLDLEKAHPELKKLVELQQINEKDIYYMNKAFRLLKDEE